MCDVCRSKRIARNNSTSGITYYFADHLGTSRVVTNATGTTLDDSDFYPFGGERPVALSSGNNYKFTGKERDPESGLDNLGARYNSSAMGRFMSPDPKILSIRHLVNPQKWNKYAYTINNPLRYFDPDGMEEIEVQLRALVQRQSVSDPLGRTFAGDNRGFSTSANASSRTSITVRIETDPSKRPGNPITDQFCWDDQTARRQWKCHQGCASYSRTADRHRNTRREWESCTEHPARHEESA